MLSVATPAQLVSHVLTGHAIARTEGDVMEDDGI